MNMKNLIAAAAAAAALAAPADVLKVVVLPGEGWWGGATTFGTKEPLGLNATSFSFDIGKDNYSNQAAPLMLSTKGRSVWSEKAFACVFTNGVMTFTGDAPIELAEEGSDLRSAFLAAARRHFPASGKTPELTYFQNQQGIIDYAKGIAANGFPSGGVIMVDDTWQHGYGVWDFDRRRFSEPKAIPVMPLPL